MLNLAAQVSVYGMHDKCVTVQDFAPEVLVGTSMFPCLQVLSSKMDLPFVNFLPAGPIDPVFDTMWRGTNFRAPLPNPLSYVPQMGMPAPSQHLVRGT